MPPPLKRDLKFVVRHVSFYIDDWIRDTREFPHLARSAYLSAIIEYMKFDCVGILNDELVMQRSCECSTKAEWDYVRDIVFGHFFKLDEASGRWHQKRSKSEYEHARAAWFKQLNDARLGGLARASKGSRKKDGRWA